MIMVVVMVMGVTSRDLDLMSHNRDHDRLNRRLHLLLHFQLERDRAAMRRR